MTCLGKGNYLLLSSMITAKLCERAAIASSWAKREMISNLKHKIFKSYLNEIILKIDETHTFSCQILQATLIWTVHNGQWAQLKKKEFRENAIKLRDYRMSEPMSKSL